MLKSLLKVTILVLIANSLAFSLADFAESTDLTQETNPNFSIEKTGPIQADSVSPQEPERLPNSETFSGSMAPLRPL